jgi:uncharacterized membrane-anchored protein
MTFFCSQIRMFGYLDMREFYVQHNYINQSLRHSAVRRQCKKKMWNFPILICSLAVFIITIFISVRTSILPQDVNVASEYMCDTMPHHV